MTAKILALDTTTEFGSIALIALLTFMLLALGKDASLLLGVLLPMTLLGISFAVLVTPLTTSVLASVTNSEEGLASGVNNAVSRIAQLAGIGQRGLLQVVQEVMAGFTIRAPSPGMVIYVKEWNGRKRTTGSQVTSWDPGVATLPDLTQMESVTYVNEIDVRKIAVGQPVGITLDADPTKRLSGTVASVANVGEQRPNADAKVFEVRVTVAGPDRVCYFIRGSIVGSCRGKSHPGRSPKRRSGGCCASSREA